MPDTDFGERTEQATPRRRRQARERGQVARSHDLSAALVLAGALALLNLLGETVFRRLLTLMRSYLACAYEVEMSAAGAQNLLTTTLARVASVLAPLLGAVGLVAVIACLLQVGAVFSAHPLTPDLGKISPLKGFRRIFSSRSLARLATSLLKLAIVGGIGYVTLRGDLDRIVGLAGAGAWEIGASTAALIFKLGLRAALALVLLGLADYGFQRWQHERNLRMTRHELREEFKELEGDPYARARRRRIQRQLALQRMMHDVPRADVVITNPTDLAVALRYDARTMEAPRVVAKGAGYLAQRIREIAIRFRIPIVERRPLAQALYRTVEVGDQIPSNLYKAVAEVLAYVYQLNRRPVPAAA